LHACVFVLGFKKELPGWKSHKSMKIYELTLQNVTLNGFNVAASSEVRVSAILLIPFVEN
jgi:hypothetical protein